MAKKISDNLEPDKRKVSTKQATYLSKVTKTSSDKIVGKTIAEVNDLLKWKLPYHMFFFQRVCGQVVQEDPASGELWPVPNATVHVEDTDCSLFAFTPVESPWVWFFPFHCSREEIATVTTDECGKFCVYIPRWDIDRILRFRRERICFSHIIKPSIRDILEKFKILPDPPEIRVPRPWPDPDPIPFLLKEPGVLEAAKEAVGPAVAEQLELLSLTPVFGDDTKRLNALLDRPAATKNITPPVPHALKQAKPEQRVDVLASHITVDRKQVTAIDFSKYIGPFLRCRDIFVPEWVPIIDIPDVTFRVTQDIDGDGTEETIYAEGFFDIRWNDTDIPDVTLEANGSALASPNCSAPDLDIGVCEKPTILTAGLMPLEPGYHNATTGYALRPNKPRHEAPPNHAHGFSNSTNFEDTETPYLNTLQLHGCHRFPNAAFYRLLYKYEASSYVPFTGLKWYAPRFGGGAPIFFNPDPDGWYPIVAADELVFPHWLLNWNTRAFANGKYVVKIQTGTAAKAVLEDSDEVAFIVDNTIPSATFDQIRWRVAGGFPTPWQTLPSVCPIIHRPPGGSIEIEVTYTSSAPHFRDVILSGYGCGMGTLVRQGDMTIANERGKFEHWHINAADNSWTNTAVFELDGSASPGCYTVRIYARSRGFNPAGSDAGPGTDWNYDPVYNWYYPGKHIAIIDAV